MPQQNKDKEISIMKEATEIKIRTILAEARKEHEEDLTKMRLGLSEDDFIVRAFAPYFENVDNSLDRGADGDIIKV